MVNAQEWLDQSYPKERRNEVGEIYLNEPTLEGELYLSDFVNLERLDCYDNKLTNCNFLTTLPNTEKLTTLDLRYNNITQDLTIFSRFTNLKYLWISNNPFYGSLEPLTQLEKLKKLDIRDTDINSGVEYLPESLSDVSKDGDEKIFYSTYQRPESKVGEIRGQLVFFTSGKMQKKWEERGFVWKEVRKWTKVGFQLNDYSNAGGWKDKNFTTKQAQEWIQAGAKTDDYEFVSWLRDTKKLGSKWITDYQEDYQMLSERFKKYRLCEECNQPNTGEKWCQSCNSKHFQNDFGKWTSGNQEIDQFIQKHQSGATEARKLLEWIPYEQFTNIEYLAQGGFGKVYKAEWTEGSIYHWNRENKQWYRDKGIEKRKILQSQIEVKKTDLEKLTSSAKRKLESKSKFSTKEKTERREELLQILLDTQEKMICLGKPIIEENWFILREKLKNAEQDLSKKLTIEEINNLYQTQTKLTQLRMKLKNLHKTVVLKSLNNSQDNHLLQETDNHKTIDDWFESIVPCYGLSQDPETKNYLMAMEYIEGGNLRQYLTNKKLGFKDKLKRLTNIIQGLKDIHQKNLVHRDFHSGNILNGDIHSFITDLGLCKPVNEANEEAEVYGVLPYVAPEVLRKKGYFQTSDIYSLGIVTYELFANASPYLDREYDVSLALDICRGLRPNIDKLKIPPLLKDLIKRCWDTDPKQRPTANELERTLRGLQQNPEFIHQLQEIEAEYNQNASYKSHTTAIMTSKLINTKEITRLLESSEKIVVGKSAQEQEILLESEEIAPIEIKEEQSQTQIEQPPK